MGDGHVYSGSLEYILDLPLLAGQKVRERLAEAEAQLRAKDGVCVHSRLSGGCHSFF